MAHGRGSSSAISRLNRRNRIAAEEYHPAPWKDMLTVTSSNRNCIRNSEAGRDYSDYLNPLTV